MEVSRPSSRKKPDKRTKGLSTPQRKERKLQQKRQYNRRLLNIGQDQYVRWQALRDRLGKSDKEMVRYVFGCLYITLTLSVCDESEQLIEVSRIGCSICKC